MRPHDLSEYVAAERQGALLLVALGVASVAFATCLLVGRSAFRAMAWPLPERLLLVLVFPLASTWAAVRLGVLVQGAVLLAFDAFVHHRALVYAVWLEQLGT